jgi:class 3 adenylate cyclase
MSSTRAELAMDTTRGLADFAPTPTRSSLDEVKLEIPEDLPGEVDDETDVDPHKELTNLRQVSFSGTLATERVFERSEESEKSLRNPTLERTHPSRRDRRSMAHTIARDHPSVTVIFIDIVGFSEMCEHVKPKAVLRFLEHYFELVDKMAEEHGVTKVRTVGDGYLAVTGLMAEMGVPEDSHQHTLRSLTFGLGVLLELRDVGLKLPTGRPVRARIGLADGNVFSGVVGKTCMQYDIFGNVANLAVRSS